MSTRTSATLLISASIGLLLAWPGRGAEAAPAEYNFAGLGAAVGGFEPQGNRFLVSDTFTQDVAPNDTMMYLNSGATSITGQIIKADNTNLARFDFKDMKFLGYAADTIQSMTITGTLAGGGTTSVTVTNRAIAAGVSYSLVTNWGANFNAFVGVTQLSFDITMAGTGQVWNFDFQSITIDNESINLPGVTPTTQASALGAVVIGPGETTPSWTNGNGSNRILFALAGTSGAPTVADGTSYTPNADFSSATDIGGGWRCVYRGSGNVASVKGLTASTSYRFVVYEMDGAGPGAKYLATVGTNAGNATTISASFLTWTSGTARTLDGAENFWSWPAGDSDASNNTYVLHRYTGYTGGGTTEVQKWNGSAWSTLTSFTPAAAGAVSFNDYNSMDVTGVDTLHVATGAAFGSGVAGARGIRYGLYGGGSWSFSTVVSYSDPNGWKNVFQHAIAVDSSGNPHVAYLWEDANDHSQRFVLRSKSGATWSDTLAISTIINSSSYNQVKGDFQLMIDGSDHYHIVYIRETSQGVRDLRYVTNAPSGTWSDTAVVSGNGENLASLTARLDSSGKVHLACSFGALGSEGTRYMTNASGAWVATNLAPSGTAYWPGGLRVRSNNDVAISLIGASDTKVMVKQGTSPWYVGAALAGPGAASEGYYAVTFTDDRKVMTTYANYLDNRPRQLNYRLASIVSSFAVTFQTDGTPGSSLTGTTSQTVASGGSSTAVTANAPLGYHLVNWTGTGGFTSTANPLTVTNVTQAMTITANFAINQYAVTFQTDGTPGATLTGTTSQTVNHGSNATAVTANVPTGYHFVNWTGTGGFSSASNPVSVTNVTQVMTITANFAINQYAVTFQTDGTSGATVTGTTSQTVNHGSNATAVTANAPSGYHLANWTGTGGFTSTANPLTVTNVTQAMTITANFAINQYAVTFQTDGTPGATLTGATSQTVNHGSNATAVTANVPTGYHFVNWTGTGGFSSTSNPVSVTNVSQAMTVTANFAINQYAVTFQTDGTPGANLTGTTSQTVNHGSNATAVTANPPTGYHLVNWTGTGGFTSTANPLTVTNVTQAMTITANFAINQYAVTFQTDGTPGATLTGATSQTVNHGSDATAVTANVPTGYHFVNWTATGGFSSTSNPVSVTNVTQAMTITANYAIIPTVVISTRTKTVAGNFFPEGSVTYTITIANTGTVDQTDNAGHELVDVLPSALALVSASATTGTAGAVLSSGTVTWDGAIPTGGSVTISVSATVRSTTVIGATVSNQGDILYDANGDGTNESSILTDDPDIVGSADPTSFVVLPRPLDFYTVTPCRLVDTRNANGPSGGPALVDGATRAFPVQGHCGVPIGAHAVALNVTVVQPSGAGHLTLFSSDVALPLASCLNYAGREFALASNVTAGLADYATHPEADLALHADVRGAGSAHVVLDVTGYFQ